MICDKIYNLESFQRQFEALLILSVSDTVPKLKWEYGKQELLDIIDWNNLLSIASILSYSNNNLHLDAALRIAQTCLIQNTCSEIQKNASAYILETLTNQPSIDLAIQKKLLRENYRESYPLALRLEQNNISIENTIILQDELLHINKFQKQVYEVHKTNDTISISAPTSAGKSFILCTILVENLLEGKKNIVYIVPTRALISQVE